MDIVTTSSELDTVERRVKHLPCSKVMFHKRIRKRYRRGWVQKHRNMTTAWGVEAFVGMQVVRKTDYTHARMNASTLHEFTHAVTTLLELDLVCWVTSYLILYKQDWRR